MKTENSDGFVLTFQNHETETVYTPNHTPVYFK